MVARTALHSPQLYDARMAGSSIAAPDAAGWVTDFLNVAYYAVAPERRDLDDLRLAFAIVTTQWHRSGHARLRAHDVLYIHRAFGRDRFLDARRTPRGQLGRAQLLGGAARLLGDWFPDAYADQARRGWKIPFETVAQRDATSPEGAPASCPARPADPGGATAGGAGLAHLRGALHPLARARTWRS